MQKKNPHFIIILSSFWNLIKFASDFALDFYPHFILISSSNPHFILILSPFPHQILILSAFPHQILILSSFPHQILILSSFPHQILMLSSFYPQFIPSSLSNPLFILISSSNPHFILILDPHFILISSSNPHFIFILSSCYLHFFIKSSFYPHFIPISSSNLHFIRISSSNPHFILILSSFYLHFILISGLNEVHETGCKLNEVRQWGLNEDKMQISMILVFPVCGSQNFITLSGTLGLWGIDCEINGMFLWISCGSMVWILLRVLQKWRVFKKHPRHRHPPPQRQRPGATYWEATSPELVGGKPTPPKTMKVNGKDDIPYMMEQ